MEFKIVKGFERYKVSATGLVIGVSGNFMIQTPDKDGYHKVQLWRTGMGFRRSVHTLVLEAFVGSRPSGLVCRHLDGNPRNNHVSNLRWGTRRENDADSARHGTKPRGEVHHSSKLTEDSVKELRALYNDGTTTRHLAVRFGISPPAAWAAATGKTWKHVPMAGLAR